MVNANEWTDEEIALLKELYPSNRTIEEIVEQFPSRTENAIRLKASRLGIKRPHISNVVYLKPITYKSGNQEGLQGYLVKCQECGSWIQIDKELRQRTSVITCEKCGSFYQILDGF